MSTPNSPDPSMRSGRLERVRSLSRLMGALCVVAGAALVAVTLYYWAVTPSPEMLANAQLANAAPREFGGATRTFAFVISMVPLAALIWGLIQARRCFQAFADGHFFSLEAVGGLKRFALAVFASALLQPIAAAALSLLLSWGGSAGTRTLALSISSDTLFALFFAGTMTVIAWVMAEAAAIADEHAQIV